MPLKVSVRIVMVVNGGEGKEMGRKYLFGFFFSLLVTDVSFSVISQPFIDPALKLRLRANDAEPISTIIHFSTQLDVRNLRLEDSPVPVAKLVSELERFNAEKAVSIVGFLKSQGPIRVVEITPIWITNSLRVKAAPQIIEKITRMNAIESIYLNVAKYTDEILDGGASLAANENSVPELTWGIEKLKADEVWKRGFLGLGVVVAVIDSGANTSHPDLRPNLWENPGEVGLDSTGIQKASNGKDDDGNGYIDDVNGWNFEDNSADISDLSGHGSQTAGIVGGMGAGGKQTGVAPNAKLMILKACCNAGSMELFESNIWLAYQYLLEHGVRVISMSLSAKHNTQPTYDKWRRASEVLLAGNVIHINSAGNRGSVNVPFNIGAPSSNPPAWLNLLQPLSGGLTSMITIGATDEFDSVRYYSSTGPVTWENINPYGDYPYSDGTKQGLVKPDVCAPSEVPSIAMTGSGYTVSFGGTSSATPHIGGVMALLVSAHPDLNPIQAIQALQATAVPVDEGFNNKCGAGRVDALAALDYVLAKF